MKKLIRASLGIHEDCLGKSYVLNSNLTITVPSGMSKEEFVERLQAATDGNCIIPKSKTAYQFKLCPGCIITIDKLGPGYGTRRRCFAYAHVGDDKDLTFCIDGFNDLPKLDLVGSEPKPKKEREELKYALYGTPDIYGRASTQWHWTSKDDYESDSDFKASVRYSAKRAAEREFREYDPRSIQ